jgi:hypothetical protein
MGIHMRRWRTVGAVSLGAAIVSAALRHREPDLVLGRSPSFRSGIDRRWRTPRGRAFALRGIDVGVSSVLALALLGSACSESGPGGPPTPSRSVEVAALVDGASLEPGTYALDLRVVRVTFTVPAGWEAYKWGVIPAEGGGEPPAGRGFGFWIVDWVFPDPCRSGRGSSDPIVGQSVDDLVGAVARQPGPSTRPRNVSLDGQVGKLIQVQAPLSVDVDRCWDGKFLRWTTDPDLQPGGGRYNQGPGQFDRLWILDVEGVRLVVSASFYPETSAEDRAELWQIVESVRID